MQKIVLASGNHGKLKEFQGLLSNCGLDVRPQADWDVDDVEETGLSFVENAILKARHASQHSGLPALADDSGLEVDALQGQPGIYSARFAGSDASDADNNHKLLQQLADVEEQQRSARFQCLLVLVRHALDPTPLICQGTWNGRILTAAAGDNGFGYDPLFYVPEQDCSSAQLPAETKNRISHRGQAIARLLVKLQQTPYSHYFSSGLANSD
jgi:XTP/dITP diphosphohydrolase